MEKRYVRNIGTITAEEQFEQAAIREAEIARQKSEETAKMLEKAEAEEPAQTKNIYTLPPLNMLSYTPDTNAERYKEELKNNYDKYHMMPVKITGMMISDDNSIRHPKLISIRDTDIDVKDCTLAKIKG